jgi:hypothetical protein
VVARYALLGSWLRLLAAAIIVLVGVTAVALVITRLPDAQAQAPKQQPPTPKQQPQPHQTAPKPAQIDRNGVLILIRSALLALDQANKTGNYTVLRDLGSPDFQANSAARLAEIFTQQRHDNVDLSGVAVIDPQLTLLPQIEENGMMHMAGLLRLSTIADDHFIRAKFCQKFCRLSVPPKSVVKLVESTSTMSPARC